MPTLTWTDRLQETVKGAEFYGPTDVENPTPNEWTVQGPTGMVMSSAVSIERAAFMYLVHFCRDPLARAELKKDEGDA